MHDKPEGKPEFDLNCLTDEQVAAEYLDAEDYARRHGRAGREAAEADLLILGEEIDRRGIRRLLWDESGRHPLRYLA